MHRPQAPAGLPRFVHGSLSGSPVGLLYVPYGCPMDLPREVPWETHGLRNIFFL